MPAWHRHPNQSVLACELMAAAKIYRNAFMIVFINSFGKASVRSVCAARGTAQQLEDRCDKNKMNPNRISRALLSNICGIKTGVLCRDLQKYSVISLVVHVPPLNMNVAGLPGENLSYGHAYGMILYQK